ncbi:MAG: aminopeptidase P N-terminal domain-containing protein [Candidatus Saccharimonadales bacterium]
MEESRFKADFFVANRRRLRKLFAGTAPIVLTANGLLQRNGDTNYRFRQDSNFWYLTGINQPDVILVMDKGKEYLILPERHRGQDIMDGKVDNELLSKTSGIIDILDSKAGWKQLSARLKRVKHVATLSPPPSYIEHYGMYANPARANLVSRIKAVSESLELLDLRPQLLKMRTIKQPQELAAMQTAIDITSRALKNVRRNISKYGYEYEIEADLNRAFRKAGAEDHSFMPPIVASGLNATIPHYMENSSPLLDKHLVLIDTGAEFRNYAADISRVYSRAEPTKRQRDVYQAVAEVQSFAINQLKPGVSIRQNEDAVEQYMGEKLRELGLIKSIKRETVRQFYPYMCSHYLGLDVHDIGDFEAPLEAGMVITVEPGIHIAVESIGIRLEDDVLITKDGVKILSGLAPKELW